MKNQTDPFVVSIVAGVFVIGGLIFIGGPQYNVWQQSLQVKQNCRKQNILVK